MISFHYSQQPNNLHDTASGFIFKNYFYFWISIWNLGSMWLTLHGWDLIAKGVQIGSNQTKLKKMFGSKPEPFRTYLIQFGWSIFNFK